MKALILSPHPDDMEYNMGGTICMLKDKGWKLTQMIFSDCVELVGNKFIQGAIKSSQSLGLKTHFRHFLNQEFLSYKSDIREEIFNLRENNYDVVFVPCRQDWHQDHQVVTEEAIRVFRKDSTILGYIKDEIYDRHHDLKVELDYNYVKRRMNILESCFNIKTYSNSQWHSMAKNPEWFEVIQLRNYL